MTTREYISRILDNYDIQEVLRKSDQTYHLQAVCDDNSVFADCENEMFCRLAFLLISQSFGEATDQGHVEHAYKLLKNIKIQYEDNQQMFDRIMGYDLTDTSLLYYFYLASLALVLDKTISARLTLQEYADPEASETDWSKRVLSGIFKALLYLIRKSNGFADIKKAILEIAKLQNEQTKFEEDYLSKFDERTQQEEAISLLAMYHTSKALTETADYLLAGYNYKKNINSVVRQHIDLAMELIPAASRLRDFVPIIHKDLLCLIRNSIWYGTAFHDQVKKLCEFKSKNNILELLPSQHQAMSRNLFDVFANATIVQMPTSAGKTLLAEFNIVLTKSLRRDARIVYIVPSRALVNQIYFDLRKDLSEIGLNVERTSTATEIDPTETSFLVERDVDVIVSTPEKMDLLIRRSHPSVQDVSLFIIDEAHTIENGSRGARLELLIAMLRRERPNAKYMLLSPFLPGNVKAVEEWLGGGNSINVDWRPSEKIVVGLKVSKTKATFNLLPSAYSLASYQEDKKVIDNPVQLVSSGDKERILEFSCRYFPTKGKTMLILCPGKTSANNTADKICGWINTTVEDDKVRAVQKYIDEELGCESLFSRVLGKGVAIHHAGLSDETKLLTEELIRENSIKYICATTTVAEGVNFPVSSVYFDSYKRGENNVLSSNDFWNIAGRAGRTMVDDFGKIILPFNDKQNEDTGRTLISRSAEEIASVLAKLFEDRETVLRTLKEDRGLESLMINYTDAFMPMFQYFVHLLTISGNEYAFEMDDLFKDSLAYYMLDSEQKRNEFIDLCKQIYQSLQTRYSSSSGILKYADKTGFSVPSVLKAMAYKAENSAISDLDSWSAEAMFDRSDTSNLTEKIQAISVLKETELGTDEKTGKFSPKLIAEMLTKWVKGDKINDISIVHPHFNKETDADVRLSDFVTYINGLRFKASWGLSALEGIVRGNEDEIKDSYIPSFVYYGVDNEKALAMRMLGVPRSLSCTLSEIIQGPISEYSFSKLRKTIRSLSLNDWDSLKPQNSKLSGEEWRYIVYILMK